MNLYTASVQGIAQRSVNGILAANETPYRDFGLYIYTLKNTHIIYSYIYIY